MRTKRYRGTVTPDNRYWLVQVEGVGATQGRTLAEVEPMARDLISTVHEVEPDAIELVLESRLPPGVEAHLSRAQELRKEAAHAQSEAAAESRAAARKLAAAGLTLRQIGELLGISHQRAHQLVSSETDAPERPERPATPDRVRARRRVPGQLRP